MKNTCILLALILIATPALAQVKKGNKLLAQKEYDSALTAFQKHLDHPVYRAAALLGMAGVYAEDPRYENNHIEALCFLREAETIYDDLPAKSRRKLAKVNMRKTSMAPLEKTLVKKAIGKLKPTDSILELDEFLGCAPKLSRAFERELDPVRKAIIERVIENSNSYDEWNSLFQNHYQWMGLKNLRFKHSMLENRLLWAFAADRGVENIQEFISDHPKHSISDDCWIKAFVEAARANSVAVMLDFMKTYPLSVLDLLAEWHIQTISLGRQAAALGLNETQTIQYNSLKDGWQLAEEIYNHKTTGDWVGRVANYLELNAPSVRTFYLFQDALQLLLIRKEWDAASRLAHLAQPLFPDEQPEGCNSFYDYYTYKQPWFSIAIPIIDRPAQGIERLPITELNTDAEEISPVISADGQTLYFATKKDLPATRGEDIYASQFDFDNGKWGKPSLVESLSGEGDEGPLSITSDGRILLLFRDGKLFTSTIGEKGWAEPKILPEDINSFPWVGRAVFSPKGDVLIFEAARQLPEEFHEADIDLFFSRKNASGRWSKPASLGPDINTRGRERSPFLHADGKTLYFSSDSLHGLGGMDVYVARRLNQSWTKWSAPQNMGKEFNTLEDDWGYNLSISASGEIAYLSGDESYWGNGDLYATGIPEFVRPEPRVPLLIHLIRETGKPLETDLLVIDRKTGQVIDTVRTLPNGTASFLAPDSMELRFVPFDRQLFPTSVAVDVTPTVDGRPQRDSLHIVSMQEMLQAGKPAPLPNVRFEYNSADLTPSARQDLADICLFLQGRPWKILISGHTDNEGSESYNQELSFRRALAVKDFLIACDLPEKSIEVQGKGSSVPLDDNQTEEGRARNRRVEVNLRTE